MRFKGRWKIRLSGYQKEKIKAARLPLVRKRTIAAAIAKRSLQRLRL